MTTVVDDFMTENFSIVLSWEMQEPEPDTYTYRISINTSAQPVHTNLTTIALEGEYNMPLDITITAMNCAGTSEEVMEVVHVGMFVVVCIHLSTLSNLPHLIASGHVLCKPQSKAEVGKPSML